MAVVCGSRAHLEKESIAQVKFCKIKAVIGIKIF